MEDVSAKRTLLTGTISKMAGTTLDTRSQIAVFVSEVVIAKAESIQKKLAPSSTKFQVVEVINFKFNRPYKSGIRVLNSQVSI